MRHPLHSICPYFAMFPEDFVAKQLYAYTKRGDTVFDPFSGRGTTVFESLLNERPAAGVDVNPVAVCISGAKADPPKPASVIRRLDLLEGIQKDAGDFEMPRGDFFPACFHERTLQQVLFLRKRLDWSHSRVDRFIAAVLLGCLHGESHKSRNCISNRMPRTISTNPDYSVRWWEEKGYTAPERDVFSVLRRVSAYRLSHSSPKLRGSVRCRDARKAAGGFRKLRGSVSLIVTSPPYLDTTRYAEDQWLRLWFLGGPERPTAKATRPACRAGPGAGRDDRYRNREQYWQFLAESWAGCADLLKEETVIVVRIGGTSLDKADLLDGLRKTLEIGLADFDVSEMGTGVTTEIRNRQTNAFRPGTTPTRYEHDFNFALKRKNRP